MLKKTATFTALIPLVCLACAACSPPGTYTIKSQDGQATVNVNAEGGATYPAALPIEQYPSSKVLLNASNNGSASQSVSNMVQLTTSDAINTVAQFYQGKLGSGGWNIDSNMTVNGMSMLHATKGSDQLTIQIMPDTGGTSGGTTTIMIQAAKSGS